MIQDIAPHVFHNEFQLTPIRAESPVLFFREGAVLCRVEDGRLVFPRWDQVPGTLAPRFLFTVDDGAYFLGREPGTIPEGFDFRTLQELRHLRCCTKVQSFVLYTGKHLADWYRDNRFCGRCGRPMDPKDGERAMKCPSCGYTSYPRIMPAVIVAVIWEDKLLLTRYRVGVGYNALIAGFTEIGETLEETVKREVMEEAGIRVKNIRYYKSQPWGIANDLLAGFYCDVDGDTAIHMDADELSMARWVPREEIVLQPDTFSLTNEMMARFKAGEDC